MTEYDLGKVVGEDGQKGDDGSTLWYTSTAPTYANSKYTFTISNLSGKSGLEVAVNDIIFYSTYYYIVSAVNSTTVDCSTRVNIKGSDASVTIQTSWGSTTSDSKVPSEKLTKTSLDDKISKSSTAGLVKNDGTIDTTTYLSSLPSHTHGNLQSDGSVGTSSNASKNVVTDSNGKITTEAKPTIPTKTSDLTNDGADGTNIFVANNDSRLSDARTPSSHTHGQVTNDGKITSTAVTVASGDNIVITDASDSSKVKRVANILADHVKDGTAHANIGSSANDSQATINTDINTALGNKQATLVSGTNIKTVNNESLLGSGNITIQGGSTVDIVTSWNSTTSDSKVPSEKLTKTSLDDKISKSNTSGLVKNDGTIDTTSYSTFSGSYSDLSNKPSIPASSSDLSDGSNLVKTSSTTGLIKNDGSIDTTTYLSSLPSHTHGNLSNDGKIGSNANYIVVTTTGGAITSVQKLGNITYDGKVGTNANYFVYTTTSGQVTSKQKIGNIDTSGAIGSTSGLPIKTGTSGILEAGSFGTTAGTFAEGNHTHSAYVNPTKVTSWSSTPSDSNVASEKLIKDTLDTKQATLVSGTSIKTINNESLLGSGNITVGGGSSVDIVTSWNSTTSDSKVPSEKLTKDTIDNLGIMDLDQVLSNATIVFDQFNQGVSFGDGYLIYNHNNEKMYYDKNSSGDGDSGNELATMNDIPSLTNYVQTSSTTGLLKNDGTVMTSGTGSSNYAAGNHTHSGYVSATKVTSWQSTPSDSNVPSEKLVKDYIDNQIGTAIQYIQQ